MSLIKAIEHGKERRQYRGGKASFAECRNHNGCPICFGNRMHSARKRILSCEQDIASLNEAPVNERIKVSRPWSMPYGIPQSQARANLARLSNEWVRDESPIDWLLDRLTAPEP